MKLHSERASTSNPAKRRETKIAQFKQQTDVKQAIAVSQLLNLSQNPQVQYPTGFERETPLATS